MTRFDRTKDHPLPLKTPPGTADFGVYVPPLMEALGLCDLEHQPKNNRIRAK